MKFKVTRTSVLDEEIMPCENAYKSICYRIDTRTVDDPNKLKYNNGENEWYKNGKHHRLENGFIKRDIKEKCWKVEVNTLDDLIKFISKNGEIVVESEKYSIPSIEIYDGYRE